KCVNVSQFLVRNNLRSVRRHLSRRLAQVAGEHNKWDRVRSNARPGHYRALSFAAVTFVAAVLGENPFSVFGVADGSIRGFRLLWRCFYESHTRATKNERHRKDRNTCRAVATKGFHA